MKQLTVNNRGNKQKKVIIKSIKAGLKEVEQIQKGKLKSIPIKDLLCGL